MPERHSEPGTALQKAARESETLTWFEAAVLLLAAALVAYQIFLPPVVGLADNGDFEKIMGQVGLRYRTEDYAARYFRFVNLQYDADLPWWLSGYLTSELFPVAAARFYATGLAVQGTFDLRVLGALHGVLFLGGLSLLLIGGRSLRPWVRAVTAALCVFMFTDVGYTALDNSLYSATASFLFLFLLAGIVLCLSRGLRSPTLSAGYWLTALLVVASKPQECILAPALAVLAVVLGRQDRGPGTRGGIRLGSAALCGVAVLLYLRTPRYLTEAALYNNLFQEILRDSPDPRADLRELGLPSEWTAYAGTNAFQKDTPLKQAEFREELFGHVGNLRIAFFELRHPARLLALLRRGAAYAFSIRPGGALGNFTSDSGAQPHEQSRAVAAWSSLKATLAPYGALVLPFFWLANGVGALWVFRRSREAFDRCLAAGVAALVAMGVTEYGTCLISEGLNDLERHLLSFNAMTDLCVIADVAVLFSAGAARLRPPLVGPARAAVERPTPV